MKPSRSQRDNLVDGGDDVDVNEIRYTEEVIRRGRGAAERKEIKKLEKILSLRALSISLCATEKE